MEVRVEASKMETEPNEPMFAIMIIMTRASGALYRKRRSCFNGWKSGDVSRRLMALRLGWEHQGFLMTEYWLGHWID